MNCRILKPVTGGIVKAIPSKSAAHRIMIAAGLSGVSLEGRCDNLSDDITATKECIDILMGESEIRRMNPRESGSTLRFLVPVAGAMGGVNEFMAEGRLPQRPMTPLKNQMEAHGCIMSEEGENPIRVEGRLTPGVFQIPGNVSSQYVTGLLMALPLCDGDSEIRIDGILQSRPYVDMTLQVLRKAGIAFEEKNNSFFIKGNQKYRMPSGEADNIEGDWSNGAFWFVMDKITEGSIECRGLDLASAQGDRHIADWLYIKDSQEEISIDVGDIPDLVPVLSVLASARKKGAITNIVNAGRLRLKESDRLDAVTSVMNGIGAEIEEGPDYLKIRGVERLKGGNADGHNDHRIVMMAATAACISEEPIVITGCEAVSKSYPKFFDDYESLGGVIEWI